MTRFDAAPPCRGHAHACGRGRSLRSRRALVACLCALLAACGGGSDGGSPVEGTPPPAPLEGAGGWSLLRSSPESPANARHDDVVFLDAANGWLINTRGEVYRTRDGGASWEALARVDAFLRCVGFASLTKGWTGNLNVTAGQIRADYSLFESEDGGRTWANVSGRIRGVAVIGLCGMRVVTPATIVAVGRWNGPPVFVKSVDGGRTWTSRSLAPLASGLIDVHFFNEQDGLAVGGLGVGTSEAEQRASRTVILATADGGETWEARYTSVNMGEWAWKIHFVDDRVGFVTTEGPTAQGVVLRTGDGGRTWQPLLVSLGAQFQGVAFVSPQRGWVGSFPTLFSTADGGATWTPLQFGTRVNRMRVVRPDLVFASGDRVYRWTP